MIKKSFILPAFVKSETPRASAKAGSSIVRTYIKILFCTVRLPIRNNLINDSLIGNAKFNTVFKLIRKTAGTILIHSKIFRMSLQKTILVICKGMSETDDFISPQPHTACPDNMFQTFPVNFRGGKTELFRNPLIVSGNQLGIPEVRTHEGKLQRQSPLIYFLFLQNN